MDAWTRGGLKVVTALLDGFETTTLPDNEAECVYRAEAANHIVKRLLELDDEKTQGPPDPS